MIEYFLSLDFKIAPCWSSHSQEVKNRIYTCTWHSCDAAESCSKGNMLSIDTMVFPQLISHQLPETDGTVCVKCWASFLFIQVSGKGVSLGHLFQYLQEMNRPKSVWSISWHHQDHLAGFYWYWGSEVRRLYDLMDHKWEVQGFSFFGGSCTFWALFLFVCIFLLPTYSTSHIPEA